MSILTKIKSLLIFNKITTVDFDDDKTTPNNNVDHTNTTVIRLDKYKRPSFTGFFIVLIIIISISQKVNAIGSDGNFCQAGSNRGKVHFVEAGDLKYVDMTTGAETTLFSPPSSAAVINNSAYNHEQGLLYYVKDAGNASNTSIHWYDIHEGVEGLLTSNINTNLGATYTGNTVSTASGGGVVVNGHFYFGTDINTSGANAFEMIDIELSANGKSIVSATGLTKGQSGTDHNVTSSSGPYTLDPNVNYGDVGAQIVNGSPYLVFSTLNCLIPGVVYEACHWSWNLSNNVVKTFTKSNAGGQMGYSENGELLHFSNPIERVNVSAIGDLSYTSTGITNPGPFDASGCMAYDYGDSPYLAQTNDATGAKHILTGLRLGTLLDGDATPHISADASGDDTSGFDADGQDDDDGVTSFSTLIFDDTTYSVDVSCNNTTSSGTGSVAGWIDFDGNGSYDSNERSNITGCNNTTVTLNWIVPGDTVPGDTFARFRIAPTNAEVANPTGLANGGEVEDYPLSILAKVDLTISKTVSVSDSTPNVGDTITFNLVVQNLGPSIARDVLVTDIVPAGFTYVVNSMTGIPSAGGVAGVQSTPATAPGLSWTIETLTVSPAVGSSTTLTFQAVVNAP